MISFKIATDHVMFRLPWQNNKRYKNMRLPRPSLASEDDLQTICVEFVHICQRYAAYTRTNRIRSLRTIFRFASAEGKILPSPLSAEWKAFIDAHYLHHLSSPEKNLGDGDKSYASIRMEWTQLAYIYKGFKQRQIIPFGVGIPTIKQPQIHDNENIDSVLDSVEDKLWPLTDANDLWPKNYLVDKGLTVSTDRFLDTLQSTLEKRTRTIVIACEQYWNKVLICQAIGENIISSIPEEEIERVLASRKFYKDNRYIADPSNADGVGS